MVIPNRINAESRMGINLRGAAGGTHFVFVIIRKPEALGLTQGSKVATVIICQGENNLER